MGELDERSTLADTQKIEIVALRTQVDALKERLDGAGHELKAVEDRRDAERVELKAATPGIAEERGRVENLGRRVAELEQQLLAQTKEAEILGRRAQDLESRLSEQSRLLDQSEFELKQLRAGDGSRAQGRKRSAHRHRRARRPRELGDAKPQDRKRPAAGRARSRQRRARPLCARARRMKRETEETWASERVENALLRERINDVAAEVARLASALEGPNSPIDAILAAETSRAAERRGANRRRCQRRERGTARQRQSGRPHPRAADACLAAAARRRSENTQLAGLRALRLTRPAGIPYIAVRNGRALSSAGERSLHTGEVVGSIPTAPTIKCAIPRDLRQLSSAVRVRKSPGQARPSPAYGRCLRSCARVLLFITSGAAVAATRSMPEIMRSSITNHYIGRGHRRHTIDA